MINEADDAKRRQMIATFNRLKPQSLSAVAAHLWVMLEKMTPGDVGSVEPLNRIIEQIQSSSEDAKTQKAKFGRVWHPSSKVLQRTSQLIDKTWGLSNDEEQEMFELIEGMKTTQSASTLLHRKLATRVTGMLSDLLPFDSVREEFRLLQQQVAQLSVSAMASPSVPPSHDQNARVLGRFCQTIERERKKREEARKVKERINEMTGKREIDQAADGPAKRSKM